MTFNIHHGKGINGKTDLRRILAELIKAEADIIALQEVDRFQLRSFFQDQIAALAKGTGMFYVYSPSINLGPCQYGNAILSKWPIKSKKIVYLNGGVERRSILTASIHAMNSASEEKAFTIVNTHLGVYAQEYTWQMPIVAEVIAKLPKPSILLGDFNMEPHNEQLRLKDTVWRKIELEHSQATMVNGKQIDHIFVNDGFKEANTWVQKTTASDHHAVVANLPYFLE